MKRNGRGKLALVAGLLACSFLVSSTAMTGLASQRQAYGNEIYTVLVPDHASSLLRLVADRTVELRFPADSAVAQAFSGENRYIRFSLKSENGTASDSNGMGSLIEKINRILLDEKKSPLSIESATLNYIAAIKKVPQGALISYRIEILANITGYTLQKGAINATDGTETPAIVDLDWRDLVVRGPIEVDSEIGRININQPAGLLEITHPEVSKSLLNSEAKEIMEDPILNFETFSLPMGSWHYLFDVTGKQVPQIFQEGEGKTLSIYSIGESSFREGVYAPEVKDATVSLLGTEVKIHAQTPPPSGQISIAGYSSLDQNKGGSELAVVYSNGPGNIQANLFPFQVLLALGGMMGAVAIAVLIKARK